MRPVMAHREDRAYSRGSGRTEVRMSRGLCAQRPLLSPTSNPRDREGHFPPQQPGAEGGLQGRQGRGTQAGRPHLTLAWVDRAGHLSRSR